MQAELKPYTIVGHAFQDFENAMTRNHISARRPFQGADSDPERSHDILAPHRLIFIIITIKSEASGHKVDCPDPWIADKAFMLDAGRHKLLNN